MYNSELLKTPPEGIQVKQEANHVTITVEGNLSVYTFYGLLILALGVIFFALLFTIKMDDHNIIVIFFALAFIIVGAVMMYFDYTSKTTTTHITIDSQNHIDISTKRNGDTVESAHFDHIQTLAYQELMLYQDGLIKTAPVHRIIPTVSDGEHVFTIQKLPKAKWEWLQQLFSELIDLYSAEIEPEVAAAEEAAKRSLLEDEEE